MQINNSTPSFGKIHINSSEMTSRQNNISNLILDRLDYKDEYLKADENDVDLYFMPAPNQSVKVYCVDVNSQQIIKNKNSKDLTHTFSLDKGFGNLYTKINALLKSLDKINKKEIKRPLVNTDLIANAQTDVARLRPEVYEEIKDLKRTFPDDNETISTIFVDEYKTTNETDNF